jgi:DNA repair exonuclease SbcCD ATPase subunit
VAKRKRNYSPPKGWLGKQRETTKKEFAEVHDALDEYKRHKASAIVEAGKLTEVKQEVQDALDAQKLIQEVAASVQTQANERIAAVVGRALKTVFPGSGYDFAIRFERKAGRTQARMVYLKDGEEADPKDDSGGVGDVAAFALRVACLLFSGKRKLLTLDEPFRQLHGQRIADAARLMELLAEELDLQIVIVTHDPALQVGKVINLGE